MHQQKGKKILIYLFLFLIVGSINNTALTKIRFEKIQSIQISGLNLMMIFCRLLFGSEIFTLYEFFLNSFATCNPVSRLIDLSFEIPPDIINIFFLA